MRSASVSSSSPSFSPGRSPTNRMQTSIARPQAGETNELLRDVEDPHLLAHVEHEDVAAVPEDRRLDDELTRLRNRHEVATDFGMRHRERSALRQLPLEDRDDAAVASQNVAETDGHEGVGARPDIA